MPTTVALVRWSGGWHEVVDAAGLAASGRKEAMLSLGAQQSIAEVERVAGRELSGAFARAREQLTAEHRPASVTERPYVGYQPSDMVTADNFDGTPTLFPVIGMAVSEDDDGQLTFVPAIGDVIVGIEDLQEQLRFDARSIEQNRADARAS